jgi:S1-C subfamily serine protease
MNQLEDKKIIYYPTESVTAIMTYSDREKRRTGVLGTGFFINANGVLLTAKHIFDGYDENKESLLVMFVDRNEKVYNVKTKIIHKSKKYDIAALKINATNNACFKISNRELLNNSDYMTVEFSRMSINRNDSTGIQTTFFNPSCRKGNIITTYISEYPESEPTKIIEVSFPVLQGASGAPLFEFDSPNVVGMITYSIGYELTPAQTTIIHDGDHYSEETKYFLPVGRAIHFEHLIEFIDELKNLK